jgi:hypothetical protein
MGRSTELKVRLTGDSKSYSSALFKGVAANDSFNRSVTGVNKGLTAIDGPLNGIAGRFSAISSLAVSSAAGFTMFGAAIAGASFMMVSAIREHDQFNLRNKKTEALLKATGFAAGFTSQQLDEMAKSLALNTLASVEGIKDAQNVLLTFKSVSGGVFEEAIELSQDLASVMGSNAKNAAMQLGKALESPTQGMTALRRSGVSFTQSERDMIKAMEDAGEVADAQRYILDTLRSQIGGAGSSEGDGTVVGAIDSMSQHWQELKINVADSSGAAAGATNLFNAISNGLESINQDLWPDDERRMQELAAQRMELKAELASLSKGDHTGFVSLLVGTDSEFLNVNRALDSVTKEMREIQDRQKKRIQEEQAAAEAAKQKELKRQEELRAAKAERDAEEQARIREKDAANLAALEMKFATEEEKTELHLQKHLDRIAQWQLSEQEIKARGFESMAELQEHYRTMAYEKYDADLLKIEQRQLESELEKTKIQEEQAKKRADAEKASRRDVLNAYSKTSGEFLEMMEESGDKQNAIYKILFASQQAAQVAMTIANAETAAAAVTAREAPVMGLGAVAAGNVVRGLGYASAGIIAGQAIAGIAHGGMGYIPEESTYLLQKGEGVLSPKQNAEVQRMAQDFNAGKSSVNPVVVNLIEDNSKAGQVVESQGANGEQMIDVFVANIREGGAASQQLENTYGLQRQGR